LAPPIGDEHDCAWHGYAEHLTQELDSTRKELKTTQEQTFVLFTHANWREPVECMHHCSTKWATFLLSLKDWLEREEGRPVPYDVKIHIGD